MAKAGRYPRINQFYKDLQTIREFIDTNLSDVGYSKFASEAELDSQANEFVRSLEEYTEKDYVSHLNLVNPRHEETVLWLEEKIPKFLEFMGDVNQFPENVTVGDREVMSKNTLITIMSVDLFRDTYDHYFRMERIVSLMHRGQYNRLPILQEKRSGRNETEDVRVTNVDDEVSVKKCVDKYLKIVKRDRIVAPSPLLLEGSSGISQDHWKAITKDLAFLLALEKKVRLRATSFKFAKREETREFWAKVLQNVLSKIEQRRYNDDTMSHSNVTTAKTKKQEDRSLLPENTRQHDPYGDLDDMLGEMTKQPVKSARKPSNG